MLYVNLQNDMKCRFVGICDYRFDPMTPNTSISFRDVCLDTPSCFVTVLERAGPKFKGVGELTGAIVKDLWGSIRFLDPPIYGQIAVTCQVMTTDHSYMRHKSIITGDLDQGILCI